MIEKVLSKRLSAAAAFVPSGTKVCDVGADHAALSLYLLKKEIANTVIVSDIHPLPLERARLAIESEGLEHRAHFCLADGVLPLLEYRPDCFVIAGMGGETIAGMLSVPQSRFFGCRFILQPMTKIPELRRLLAQKGYDLCRETAVEENGRVFVVMDCVYDGSVRSFTPVEYLAGVHHLRSQSPESRAYLLTLCDQLDKRISGLKKGGLDCAEQEKIRRQLDQILKGEPYDPS